MHNNLRKWFLIGFGIRAAFAVVMTVFVVWNYEIAMLYFMDLPILLFITLAEEILPTSLFRMLVGKHPFYLPMNFVACLLWGGIFMLFPLARNMVFILRRRIKQA